MPARCPWSSRQEGGCVYCIPGSEPGRHSGDVLEPESVWGLFAMLLNDESATTNLQRVLSNEVFINAYAYEAFERDTRCVCARYCSTRALLNYFKVVLNATLTVCDAAERQIWKLVRLQRMFENDTHVRYH